MSFAGYVELKPRDVKTATTTKRHPLGTRGMTGDGRVYKYAYCAGTLVAGTPVMTIALTLLDSDTAYTAPINDTEDISTTWRSFTVETETATGALAANEYADGYVLVATSTNTASAGQLIKIKSNDASATTSTDALGSTMTITFADEDKLAVYMTTGDVTTLHHNPYYGVLSVTGGANTAGGCVGVPNIAVTATQYAWIQTWGPCAVYQEGVLVTGNQVSISTDTDEGVALVEYRTSSNSTQVLTDDTDADAGIGYINALAATQQSIGWGMGTPGTDTYWGLIFLTISP